MRLQVASPLPNWQIERNFPLNPLHVEASRRAQTEEEPARAPQLVPVTRPDTHLSVGPKGYQAGSIDAWHRLSSGSVKRSGGGDLHPRCVQGDHGGADTHLQVGGGPLDRVPETRGKDSTCGPSSRRSPGPQPGARRGFLPGGVVKGTTGPRSRCRAQGPEGPSLAPGKLEPSIAAPQRGRPRSCCVYVHVIYPHTRRRVGYSVTWSNGPSLYVFM